ncbi:oxidoreductase NAD-binding domain protein [Necator americanus]|uniref:Oxidoreductase NAD-binding domain protein n=1 Tax=Necator americanus TaxID=51031 RepID=W2TXX3_NECAM|nr:oxidoreductase NAD-binding domain protein [Necator americanus]ETN86529.1 oxidoreductase NAD-binding domain protein [Necator americanus]
MRAAGTDATDLFNQYHAWVNYDSMLKSCLVGRFTGDLSKLPQPGPSTSDQPQSVSAQLNALIVKGKQKQETYGVDIIKDATSVTLKCQYWTTDNLRLENVAVDWSSSKQHFRIVVRPMGNPAIEVKWGGISTESTVNGYRVLVKDGQVVITFDAEDLDVSAVLSSANHSIRQSPLLAYHECIIEEKRAVSHDTRLFTLRLPEGVFFPVGVGRHVSFKVKKGGDLIEISEPIGSTDLLTWTDPETELLMLAAGTGLTPMINMLNVRLRGLSDQGSSTCNTRLLMFNKTEQDIVDDNWMPMRWNDTRVKTEHILSEPSANWTGKTGRISADMLPSGNNSLRVLICGPDGFVQSAAK